VCSSPGYERTDEINKKSSEKRKELCKNTEFLEKMSNVQISKSIKCINNNIIYNSIGKAARELNISKNGIQAQLHNRLKKYKGYEFEYV
jgi:hypothetical protein